MSWFKDKWTWATFKINGLYIYISINLPKMTGKCPRSWCTRSAKNGRFGERRNRSGWKTHCSPAPAQSTLVNHSIGLINNAVDGTHNRRISRGYVVVSIASRLSFPFPLGRVPLSRCRYTINLKSRPGLPRVRWWNYRVPEILALCVWSMMRRRYDWDQKGILYFEYL